MTAKPCAIADCPTLAIDGSLFCAAHAPMSAMLLRAEAEAAEKRRCDALLISRLETP